MYGFDAQALIQATRIGNIKGMMTNPILMIEGANCGLLYDIDLYVKYGTDSSPAPGLSDSIVLIREGQLLDCNALLYDQWCLEHPVHCTITDSLGNEVFTKTKWITGNGMDVETDFFRDVSLSPGQYTVDWDVCAGHASHYLTVEKTYGTVTNDIDIEVVVTDTTGIDAKAAWDAIEADVVSDMLVHHATIKFNYAETKGKYLVIFHLEVTASPGSSIGSIGIEPISTALILLLIVSIAYFLVAVPAIEERRIAQLAYNTTFHKYTYEECSDMIWAEWTACMADKYPVVWNDIKDKIEAPKPPPPTPDWMTYIMYIILAVGSLAGIFILVKYVLPALKGR